MAKCNRCLLTDEIKGVTINEKTGQCNFCDLHDSIEKQVASTDIDKIINKVRKKGKGKKYDCLIGISGGFDSSFMLDVAVNRFNLRPLALHFDNGWNSKAAENNMSKIIQGLNVDFIRISTDFKELNNINRAFLCASVPDADIPNDIAMTKLMLEVAQKYNISYVFNGHNYRYEGSTPIGWTYMDGKYIESVASAIGIKIKSLPLLSIKDQLYYALKGTRSIRPLYYIDHDKEKEKLKLTEKYGWVDYGGNHAENIYTEFVGNYLLPIKFGINKKIIYLSAMLRSGIITRDEAEKRYNEKAVFSPAKIKSIESKVYVSVDAIMKLPIGDRCQYQSYKPIFEKYRFFFFILTKLGYFPKTFYKKYCCK